MHSLAHFLILIAIPLSHGDNILVLHSAGVGSHVKTISTLLARLISHHDHKVTTIRWADTIGNYPNLGENHTVQEFTFDNSDGSLPMMTQGLHARHDVDELHQYPPIRSIPKMVYHGYELRKLLSAYCDQLFADKPLLERLKRANFTLAIVDLLWGHCNLALAHHLGIPVVGFWNTVSLGPELLLTSSSQPSSYVPALISEFSPEMTFVERFANSFYKLGLWADAKFNCISTDWIVRRHFPDFVGSEALFQEISGLLMNSYPEFSFPSLLPHTFVYVGGMHISGLQGLNQDIEKFIEEADDGIIVLSFGLQFNPSVIPVEVTNAIFGALERLPQRIIARLPQSITQNRHIPKNVLPLEFLPQKELLAHPKTRLFFTHFGINGVLEAIWFGVPMVGLTQTPFDQIHISANVQARGLGKTLSHMPTESEVYNTITEVLNKKRYKENVQNLSRIIKLQGRDPLDRAVSLVNYVLETEGARHMHHSSKYVPYSWHLMLHIL